MGASVDGGPPMRAGFTLLEVLIAVVILATGLVLVLQGMHTVLYTWDGSVQRIRAMMGAQDALAHARLAVLQGDAPSKGGQVEISKGISGRDGLYHVQYTGDPDESGPPYELGVLLYRVPSREEAMP